MNDDAPPAPPGTQLARGGRCCFLISALTVLVVTGLAGQGRPVVSFEFLGFRPGMPRAAIDTAAHTAGADSLRCVSSPSDHRVGECRASLSNADADRTVDLWLSTIDDTASILTLSALLTTSRLERWRDFLIARYGAATPSARGPVTMLQWISGGRMLRLAWRSKGRGFDASVSMVDGRVLDGWGNHRPDSSLGKTGSFP
ncbi:MAG: hypothetical protein WBC97_07600 [Gemmatimonadales bacterium]